MSNCSMWNETQAENFQFVKGIFSYRDKWHASWKFIQLNGLYMLETTLSGKDYSNACKMINHIKSCCGWEGFCMGMEQVSENTSGIPTGSQLMRINVYLLLLVVDIFASWKMNCHEEISSLPLPQSTYCNSINCHLFYKTKFSQSKIDTLLKFHHVDTKWANRL